MKKDWKQTLLKEVGDEIARAEKELADFKKSYEKKIQDRETNVEKLKTKQEAYNKLK